MELKMSGHAEYAEKGQDIVCSAASILFFTLNEALLQSEEMLEEKPVITYEDGNGLLSCKPKEEYKGNIARTYWTVLVGIEMLARCYPKNVKLKVVG